MVGVETSQHVKLSYEPAGVGERILAFIIDGFFMGVYWFVVISIWGYFQADNVGENVMTDQPFWILYLVLMLPIMSYHLVSEVLWKGYSPGKKLVGIRVVKADGTRANLSGYLIRWLFRLVEISMTSGVLAFVTVLLNGKGQRLGDIVGKTCVIKERKNVSLDKTLYAQIHDRYEPMFPQVVELSDEDVSIIRDVLNSKGRYDTQPWFDMLQRTRDLTENKLGTSNRALSAEEFLKTVIKDYNAVHGKG